MRLSPWCRSPAISCLFLLSALVLGAVGGAAFGGASANAADLDEIERRLALPPFAYVAETEYDSEKIQQGGFAYSGVAAFVDSKTDTLVARPTGGSSLQGVAVAPDGSRFYMTDAYEPVLHVFDAETRAEIDEIALPGVEPHDPMRMADALKDGATTFPYAFMRMCSSGVACTPDGSKVLVTSSAGLQVVDVAASKVVRTISDLRGGSVAVSFDGERAYVDDDNFDELAPRSFVDWFTLIAATEECRLVCVDLKTWQFVEETPSGIVAGIAVKPDDSQVFFSETYKKRVRVVDALSLEDRWSVSTEPSFSIGIGFVPNGTKAYVVCSADNDFVAAISGTQAVPSAPKAEDYFCAVIDTAEKEIVKRIPLEAY